MVDYDNMGPSLQLVRAQFLNFLSKLSRDFKLRGMLNAGWLGKIDSFPPISQCV